MLTIWTDNFWNVPIHSDGLLALRAPHGRQLQLVLLLILTHRAIAVEEEAILQIPFPHLGIIEGVDIGDSQIGKVVARLLTDVLQSGLTTLEIFL